MDLDLLRLFGSSVSPCNVVNATMPSVPEHMVRPSVVNGFGDGPASPKSPVSRLIFIEPVCGPTGRSNIDSYSIGSLSLDIDGAKSSFTFSAVTL